MKSDARRKSGPSQMMIERGQLARMAARRLAVGVVVAALFLLSAQEWYQYRQVAHAGVPVSDCSSTERVVEYDVRWQWLPPGIVCVFGDGTTKYVGL